MCKVCRMSRRFSARLGERHEDGSQRHGTHRDLLDIPKHAPRFGGRALRVEARLDEADHRARRLRMNPGLRKRRWEGFWPVESDFHFAEALAKGGHLFGELQAA